jgi:hypothetical protein
MNTRLCDFIKSAAEYSQETGDIVSLAYGIVNDIKQDQQKCAALVPNTLTKLEALDKVNGQPFVPDGFSKQAAAVLSSHDKTLALLGHVLNEYGQLKSAFDKLAPPIGGISGKSKQAAEKRNVMIGGPDSQAMDKFNELLVNI